MERSSRRHLYDGRVDMGWIVRVYNMLVYHCIEGRHAIPFKHVSLGLSTCSNPKMQRPLLLAKIKILMTLDF